MNYINQNPANNYIYPKRISKSPMNYGHKYSYGEKIREKNNYTLYVSGTGYERPHYEERQKGIKIILNRNDNPNYNYNKINQQNKIIKIYQEENDDLSYSDNYKYKETKNIKRGNPNLKIVTIHKRLGSPIRQIINSPKRNKYIKMNQEENIYWKRQYSPNKKIHINNGEQISVIRENKSSEYFHPLKNRNFLDNPKNNGEYIQEIIENDDNEYYVNNNEDSQIETRNNGDYFIKVTTTRKEFDPNNKYYNEQNNIYKRNNKDKIIKIVRNDEEHMYNNQNQENCAIYRRKNIQKDNYENEPYYIGNYGEEENYEGQEQYNVNNNYRYKEVGNYENKINNRYKRNIYKQENEYIEDIRDIKNIECPLHGKISIIIHKNPLGYN